MATYAQNGTKTRYLPLELQTFDAYRDLATRTLCGFEYWRKGSDAAVAYGKLRNELHKVARFNERRAFREAERRFAAGSGIGAWCANLFLAFRDRTAMIDYLRLQECAFREPDGGDPIGPIATGVRETMVRLGRPSARNTVVLRIAAGKRLLLNLKVQLDPFSNYRAIYCCILMSSRRKGAMKITENFYIFSHLAVAEIKIALLKFGVTHVLPVIFASPSLKTNASGQAVTLLAELFDRRGNTLLPLERVIEELTSYFTTRVASMAEALPSHSAREVSMSKFGKVFVGVVIGRAYARPADVRDLDRYIADTFKIAYCWGSTYPLVDDMLDSSQTTSRARDEVVGVMQRNFFPAKDYSNYKISSRAALELNDRMQELLKLVSPELKDEFIVSVQNVFRAHIIDSELRLGQVGAGADKFNRMEVALLKSLLVRIATMIACGISASVPDIIKMAQVAIFNQLGDDIWDATEDLSEERVTPVTSYLQLGGDSPYTFYHEYGAYLGAIGPPGTFRAVALAIAHTHRLAHENGTPRTRAVQLEALTRFAPDLQPSALFEALPAVDPDSLIFSVEKLSR